MVCAVPSVKLGLVKSLLANVDCNVNAISQGGYQAIAAPGSQLFYALTILLTLYVAVFGLRLLLGLAPLRVGDLSLSALKIGLVLALATSWPTYQVLLYETLFRGPEQFATSMLAAMQPSGSLRHGSPFDGLQIVYDRLQTAAGALNHADQPGATPSTGGSFASFSLTTSALLMLLSTLGAILAAKIVLGLLLALGPIFVAFLLFDGTRGVFEGWLRAALAFALVPLFATLALTVQLSLMEPLLAGLTGGTPDAATSSAIFILSIVSAIVSLAGVTGILVAGASLKLQWHTSRDSAATAAWAERTAEAAATAVPFVPAQPLQPRVAAIGAAAAALARRDARLEGAEPPRRFSLGARGGSDGSDAPRPAGPGHRRSAQPRRTASSVRRDKGRGDI